MEQENYIPKFINNECIIGSIISIRFSNYPDFINLSNRSKSILLDMIYNSLKKESSLFIEGTKFRIDNDALIKGKSFYENNIYPISEKLIPTNDELRSIYCDIIEPYNKNFDGWEVSLYAGR